MGFINTVASLSASGISRSRRKRTLRRINCLNRKNRNLQFVGKTTASEIIPEFSDIKNICISGGDLNNRISLIVQNVSQALSLGQSVIVLHEQNSYLENKLSTIFNNQSYVRIVNSNNPYYEPLVNLDDQQVAQLILSSSLKEHKIADNGLLYIKAITRLLMKSGHNPYIRKIASCPHNSIQNIIASAEQSGIISFADADNIRADVDSGETERAAIELFFGSLLKEGNIIAEKNNIARSTSVARCVENKGLLSIDISSTSYTTLLSLITAELESLKVGPSSVRLIIDAHSISKSESLKNLIRNTPNYINWTVVSDDIGVFLETEKMGIESLLALSHRAVLFSHGIRSSEMLSSELGEYDYIEPNVTHSGNTGLSGFGLHFGGNKSIKPEHKRELVVKAEEIEHLDNNEFIMLDNHIGSLFKGKIV